MLPIYFIDLGLLPFHSRLFTYVLKPKKQCFDDMIYAITTGMVGVNATALVTALQPATTTAAHRLDYFAFVLFIASLLLRRIFHSPKKMCHAQYLSIISLYRTDATGRFEFILIRYLMILVILSIDI